MEEKQPLSPWKTPLRGRRKWMAFLAAFVVVALVAFGISLIGPSQTGSKLDMLGMAFTGTLALSVVGLLGVWFARWAFSWRNARRLLFGFGCLVTLIALFYAEENFRGKRRLSKLREQLVAKGEKLTLAELIPAPVPDEKNFAMTPLLKPLFEFTYDSGSVVWKDTNGLGTLNALSVEINDKANTNVLKMGSLDLGTFADVKASAEFYRGNTNYPQAAAGATPAEIILTALGKYDPEVKELREADKTRPYSRFPIPYDHQPCWAILLPHLAHVKGLTRLMQMRAVAELEAKRRDEAWEDLQLGLRLSDSIREEPVLIDHLVRLATVTINAQTIQEGLARHAWTEEQLASLQNGLGTMDLLAEYKSAMRGERALGLGGLEFLMHQGWKGQPMQYLANDDGASSETEMLNLLPSGFFYQNMAAISSAHQEFNLAAVDERAHRVFPDISERGARFIEQTGMGPYTILMKLLMPAMEKASRKSAHGQFFVDAAQVACALERQRLSKGGFPESLDVLTNGLMKRIPTDVIDGKPLRYRRNPDGGYRLYSIGWNQKDDGGNLALKKSKNGDTESVDLSEGDWVWEMSGCF